MSYLIAFRNRRARDSSANYQRNRIKNLIPKAHKGVELRKAASSRVLLPSTAMQKESVPQQRRKPRIGIFDEIYEHAAEYEREINKVLAPTKPTAETPLTSLSFQHKHSSLADLAALEQEEAKLERLLRTIDRKIKGKS